MVRDGFDTSVFSAEMGRVFNDYRQLNKRALPYLLRNRMIQLSSGSGSGIAGSKGVKHKGLVQEALALRLMVQAEIRALPGRLKHHIRRSSPGRTEAQEIRFRQLQAGRFQASGWIIPGFNDITGEGSSVKTLRGQISLQLTGNNPRITITNTSPNALEFGTRTGYIARAFNGQIQDMLIYIKKHLDLTAAEFQRKYPNFKQPIERFVT